MFTFMNPYFLLLFLIFPCFYFLKKNSFLRKPELKLNLLNWNAVSKPKKIYLLSFLNLFSILVLYLGLTALIFSIAEPVIFKVQKIYTHYGNSIMFLIDISPSMAVKDMDDKTRLETAKTIIKSFTETHPADAVGLTVLASSASLLIPPTIDKQSFFSRLTSLEAGELGDGTAIGMGLAVALANMENTQKNSYIILLTDGENNTGEIHPYLVAKILKRKRIGFYVIGIGKSGYAQLEYIDKKNNKVYKGSYYTEFNEDNLKKIAAYGGGEYFFAKSFSDLNESFKKIDSQIPKTESAYTQTTEESLYFYFLFFAIIMVILSWFIRRIIIGIIND